MISVGNKFLWVFTFLIFSLNCIDVLATVFWMNIGVGHEANPYALYLWNTIGFSATTLIKLFYPFGLLFLAKITLKFSGKHSGIRDQAKTNIFVASIMIFNVVFPLYGVYTNFVILLKVSGLLL